MGKPKFPASDREIAWATLEVLKNHYHRGPMARSEMPVPVVEVLSLDPGVLDIPHPQGSISELQYRIGWSLTNLRKIGAVKNVRRGYWILTRCGDQFCYCGELYPEIVARFGAEVSFGTHEPWNGSSHPIIPENGKHKTLNCLREMDRNSFENICQRFLLEFGFLLMDVTKRTDNGFEGSGILQIDFISFRVYFRCKNSADPVDHREIRTFRKTVSERADKGLFIATSSFNQSAVKESNRDVFPTIDLVDGIELCNQLERIKIRI